MMKKYILLLAGTFLSAALAANGVVIPDSSSLKYLPLISSEVNVRVEGQVAITKTYQEYTNTSNDSMGIQFAFPLPVDASALSLSYKINGQWRSASFAAKEQDSIQGGNGGTGPDYTLIEYLGENPLIYTPDETLFADSTVIFILEYVQLLEYKLGKVNYRYPNDYSQIANDILPAIVKHQLDFSLISDRSIESISLMSHHADTIINTGNDASVIYTAWEIAADQDYHVQYSLNQEELGLYNYSTYLPDSTVPDVHGRGYFLFVAEPDPSENQEVIDKIFTLIIDRSGSMSGDKIVQARNAAGFIVQNLNYGDKFNIIDFSSEITSFRSDHVDFNNDTEAEALNYIAGLRATGSTNISGAFGKAVPQFSDATGKTANIIIFFTDGNQTAGITNTDDLIVHVDNLVVQNEAPLSIFTFGIGAYTNERLLTTIAAHNSGLSEFLGNDELEEKITEFYLLIRNPVLVNTEITTDPQLLTEVYPVQLQNLYKGQQLILAGRYEEAAPFTLTMSGEAFGKPVEYSYMPELSDTPVDKYSFIPKVWAKKKIEKLLTDYYLNSYNTGLADSIKQDIIDVSMAYRVISPFTSFQGSILGGDPNSSKIYDQSTWIPGGQATGVEMMEFDEGSEKTNLILVSADNFPNPFRESTTVVFEVSKEVYTEAIIRIYDVTGRVIAEYTLAIDGAGEYRLVWDPAESLPALPSGIFTYKINLQGESLTGRMVYKR